MTTTFHSRICSLCAAMMIALTFVAMQRIEVDAHYLSDTCAGAAIGFLVAGLCLAQRLPLPRLFSRWELPVLDSLERHEENYALQMTKHLRQIRSGRFDSLCEMNCELLCGSS